MTICNKCKKEIKEKIKLYLYYVGTSEGANDFVKLDKAGKTDSNEMAGTTRVFKYVFKEYLNELS